MSLLWSSSSLRPQLNLLQEVHRRDWSGRRMIHGWMGKMRSPVAKKTCSMRCVQRLKGWANLVYWIQRRKNGNTWRLTAPQDDNRMSCNPVSVYYSKLNTINVQHPCKCATMNTWSGHIDFQLWNKSLHTMKAVEYSRKNIQQKKLKASLVPKLSAPSAHLISALLLLSLPVVNRSGWWGRCWFLPRRFLSLVNVTGALGAQIILEKPYFLVSFRSRAQAPKEWRRVGRGVRYHIHARRNDLTYLLGISVTFPLDR